MGIIWNSFHALLYKDYFAEIPNLVMMGHVE